MSGIVWLLAEVREPLPVRPGTPAHDDYEYQWHGVKNVFLWCEPLRGTRHIEVTDRRTMRDWAHCIRDLVDGPYAEATVIRLVNDNPGTHWVSLRLASLYCAFPPAEARRIARKLELPGSLWGPAGRPDR